MYRTLISGIKKDIDSLSDMEFVLYINAIIEDSNSYKPIELSDLNLNGNISDMCFRLLGYKLSPYRAKLYELRLKQLDNIKENTHHYEIPNYTKFYLNNNKLTNWHNTEKEFYESIEKLNANIIKESQYKVGDRINIQNGYDVQQDINFLSGKHIETKSYYEMLDITIEKILVDMNGEIYYEAYNNTQEQHDNATARNDLKYYPKRYIVEIYAKYLPVLTESEIRANSTKRLINCI